jgi:hypothetical protein
MIRRFHGMKLMDLECYLSPYPDFAALVIDPAEHFLTFGQLMGCQIAPGVSFDPAELEGA